MLSVSSDERFAGIRRISDKRLAFEVEPISRQLPQFILFGSSCKPDQISAFERPFGATWSELLFLVTHRALGVDRSHRVNDFLALDVYASN